MVYRTVLLLSHYITWYHLGKMGNISNQDPGRGRGQAGRARKGGGKTAEKSGIVQSVKFRRGRKACHFFLSFLFFFLGLEKEPGTIFWIREPCYGLSLPSEG